MSCQVRRAAGRNEKDEAARKHALAPSYTLHHLVRERYPRFVDALGDMDDALTLVHLFAALPADGDIRAKVVNKAKSLAASWSAYCATTSSITKSFISVKGVYVEANVMHTTLRWVVPHAFTQNLPDAVDYKVMLTFFEFYETLLGFVLFKLYNDIGVRYPMPVQTMESGSTASVIATNLKALTGALATTKSSSVSNVVSAAVETKNKTNAEKVEATKKERALIQSVGDVLKAVESDDEDEDDEEIDVAGPLSAALESLQQEQDKTTRPLSVDEDATKRRRLFSGLTFFLSREVPRGYLELVCLAFGAKVGWEGDNSLLEMSDSSITHHVVDRPKLPSSYDKLPKSREFIQPQWILDSANFMFCLPIAKYGVGVELPPHLSPWVDDEEEGYTPAYATEIQKLRNGEAIEDEEEMEVDEEEGEGDDVENPANEEASDAEEEEEDDEEDETKAKNNAEKEDADAHDRAKVMMGRKASRLYGRMQNGISIKEEQIKKLQKRREDMKGKFKDADGKTVTMQKVVRLKKERKTVGDEYSKASSAGSMKKSKKQKTSK